MFKQNKSQPLNKIMCGSLTGLTAYTLIYPLDLIKTLITI